MASSSKEIAIELFVKFQQFIIPAKIKFLL
jgi:hypothetical protein